MHRRNVASPLLRCALGIVFLALFGSASSASVIYEYRESGSTAVVATLRSWNRLRASAMACSTVDPSDVISLLGPTACLASGSDDVLLAGGALDVGIVVVSMGRSWMVDGWESPSQLIFLLSNPAGSHNRSNI